LIFQDIDTATVGTPRWALFPSRVGAKAAVIVCELPPNLQIGLGHGLKVRPCIRRLPGPL
jgi:hypothetical protein